MRLLKAPSSHATLNTGYLYRATLITRGVGFPSRTAARAALARGTKLRGASNGGSSGKGCNDAQCLQGCIRDFQTLKPALYIYIYIDRPFF